MKKRKLLTLILLGALLGVNLNINAVQKRTQPDNPSGQSRRQEKRPRTESQEAQSPLLQRVRNVGLGNTRTNCYLNASIQCLSNLTGFRENLLRNEDLYKNDPVISKLIRVVKNLRISEHPITDLDFINSAVDFMQSQPGNARRGFQDAQEFISLIIARLDEMNPAATQSLSMRTANQFKCLSCGHEHASRIDNESGALKLDLTDQAQTLEQLLNKDFAEIQLDDDYLCDGCGLQKTTKTTKKISQYPNELMITFNRLDFDVQTQREKPKNNTPIRFPKNLDLRPYATEELQQQEVDSSYELCGIICHESRGIQHYYSYIKDSSDGRWCLYNDDSVDFVRDQDIQKVMANSPLPYVLFYKLKVDGDDEAVPMQQDDSGFDSSDDEVDASVPLERQQTSPEAEEIRRRQEAARGQQAEEFNLLMERLKVAINKLNESKLDADFQDVTLALAVVKQNPEYIRRKASLRRVDLEKIRRGEEKDLSFADLRNLDLTRFDLSNAILIGANLSGANLTETNLENSIICDSDLSNAILNATQLKNSKIINSNFNNSTINEVRTDHVLILNQTKFEHTKLINSKFKDSVIKNANFMNAIFRNFTFDTSKIEYTNMRNIKAEGISFISTPLMMVSFVLAQIKGLYIFGSGILGDQLSFKYASINKGCVLGGHSASTKVTSDEVVDYYLNDKRDFNIFKTEILKYDLAGTVVESMFFNIDFQGVKMEDVYFSQILFPSISNISESKIFIGCIFNNIVAKLNITNIFLLKGAQITTPCRSERSISYIESSNYESKRRSVEYDISRTHPHDELFLSIHEGRASSVESEHQSNESKINHLRIDYLRCNHFHCDIFDFIWKKTEYESYMQQVIKAIASGAINGLFQVK